MLQSNMNIKVALPFGLGLVLGTSKRCFGSGDMLFRASSSKSSAFIWRTPLFAEAYLDLFSEVVSCAQLQGNQWYHRGTPQSNRHEKIGSPGWSGQKFYFLFQRLHIKIYIKYVSKELPLP